jgi:drug/metabolite transporter (DMT)-like permease
VVASNIAPFLGWTLLMTFVSNIVCYNLYGLMLRKFTATFLSFVGLLSPIFASLHGWLFLGEPLSLLIFLSTAFVCLGLWIVYSTELKQGYIVKAEAS